MKAVALDMEDEEDMEAEEGEAEDDEPDLSLWRPEPPQRRHVSVLYTAGWDETDEGAQTSRESQHKRPRVFVSGE